MAEDLIEDYAWTTDLSVMILLYLHLNLSVFEKPIIS
jgi:hypothetical protein